MQLEPGLDGYDREEELAVLAAWRSQFQLPLIGTDMTVRSAVATVTRVPNGVGMVKQRFKREQQIIAKLVRSRTRLSKMEDIGGCRAVLPDLATVREVQQRIEQYAPSIEVHHIDDYNALPRPGGYRAVHLHCLRDGVPIEVQLRTERQHDWASTVEAWDDATGHDIKHEIGPAGVIEAFRAVADVQATMDLGTETPIWATLKGQRVSALLADWAARHGKEIR